MQVVGSIAAKLVGYMVEPVRQWLCYSFHYGSNMDTMKSLEEKLQDARDTMQHSIDAAKRNGEEIESAINNWLTEVDEIAELAKEVRVKSEEEAKTRSCNGRCLNLKLRHQLSKKAKKIAKQIEVLENRRFNKVSYRPTPQEILPIRYMDYMDFESRMSAVKGIVQAVGEANINMIGIWGMPGVGKTTLVREVARQVKEQKLIDEVAMADVTQSPDVGRIQGEIADMLDLKLDKETLSGRAIRLWERLTTKEKKVLVILDDIWEKINLEAIGIPCRDCKIVLISRNHDLLSCEMGTQKDFVLDVLPEGEAWSLFEKNIMGDSVNDPNFRRTATEVAKECAGLPLALVTVSKALKNKSLYDWKDALQQLRRPAPENRTRMQSTIYSSIELSYGHLESQEVQYFFLHCALMGFGIDNLDLLKYCYGLGLFRGINTLDAARNRVYSLAGNLKDSGLLKDCPHTCELYHMHDLVRDVARSIASKNRMFVVTDHCGLEEMQDVDALKRCKVLSIRGGDINELPKEMECPELRFFYMYGGHQNFHMPETFFKGMEKLKVLDLTKLQLPSLPSSLLLLTNLQTLCLDQCVLGDISLIGKLKNLVILSLLQSDISELPREIGFLTRLRLLDLSSCSKLEVIPPNVLSSLVELEDLYIGSSFVEWEADGLNNERTNASLSELKQLSQKLTTLEIHIQEASILPKDLLFLKLERFKVFVGDVWEWSDQHEITARTLKLKLKTSFHSEVGIKMLLQRTEVLYLDVLKGVKSVLDELDKEGFQQLKHLHIQNNVEIKHIINSRTSVTAFPALETFVLKNMINLEEICLVQLSLRSFRNLRVVKVEKCHKLKFVFSLSIAMGLCLLEELEVRECSIMGAIVIEKEDGIEDEDTKLFPRLKRLVLEHLPKLMSFVGTQNAVTADPKEMLSGGNLDLHMPILHEQVVFPNLEILKLSSVGMEETQYNQLWARIGCRLTNLQAMSRFQNLSHLVVEGSGNTKHLLSFPAARAMVHLKHLYIFECKGLEEVLVAEELGVEGRPNLFARLECLILKDLPILKRFCKGSNIEFPCLMTLILDHCPKLKTFITKPVSSRLMGSKEPNEMNAEEGSHAVMQPLFNEEIGFPSLETLIIFHMDDLKIIWQNQFAADSFCNLKFLFVESCENLTNVFSASVARCLLHLEKMQIVDCGVEEIVAGEGAEGIARFVFPQVTHLNLISLPRLKWFYPGAHTSEWPMLEQILVQGCQKIEIFASKLMSFQGALPESKLDISNKQRFFFSDEVVFPRLETLQLFSQALAEPQHSQHQATSSRTLTNMPSTLGFRNLLSVEVQGSENVRYLLSFSTARLLVHLKRLHIFKWKFMEEVLVGEELVVEERSTLFPKLECLFLDDLPILKRFCFGTNIEFPSLDNLRITNCPELNTFISKSVSSSMAVTVSQELGEINAVESESPNSVMQPLFNEEVAFPILERLVIVGIDNLQIIWPNQFAVDCSLKLKSMVVECCKNLVNIFPHSVARCLLHLEELRVTDCGVLEEIVAEEGAEGIARFVFPQVTILHLIRLPRLKWFCPGVHSSKWPKLKEIWVNGCKKVETFASELLSFQETLQESRLDISNKQPLFLVDEATFPNLEVLRLGHYHNIWLGHILEERFCKLKVLHLICAHNQSPVLPWNFLIRLHNLENLVLIGSWEEIFMNEELARTGEKYAQILPRLRELKLSEQYLLTQIWKEDTQPSPAFHNLEILEVSKCVKLKKLVPSSVSFQNLKILEILKCPGLIHLFTSSTAKSLVQLKKMRVCECESIREIVAEEVGEANEVIAFPKLTCLELDCLENLTKFCMGSFAFKLPSLKEVIVRQCPKLKVFCDGVLSTPKLQRVKVTKEDEWHWKNDLNSTLHLLWQEKQ